MEPTKIALNWSFEDDFLISSSNARIVLALLRCVRHMPGTLPSRQYDDMTADLLPVLVRLTKELRKALRFPSLKSVMENIDAGEDISDDDWMAALSSRQFQVALGEAIASDKPALSYVLDQAERILEDFIHSAAHPLDHNVNLLTSILDLSEPAGHFIRLAAAFCYGTIEPSIFTFIDTPSRVAKTVGLIVGCSPQDAAKLLDPGQALWRSGLLRCSQSNRNVRDLEDLLLLSTMGERLLAVAHPDETSLAACVLKPVPASPGPSLSWPHLHQERQLLLALLRNATEQNQRGINILIHGEPGTGKTEFVRQILQEVGLQAYAINHADDDGYEASRAARLAHLCLSRTFAGRQSGSVLVMDEAEDIFVGHHDHPLAELLRPTTQSKAWMNDILEQAPQPVIWISNKVSHMDPAYLRRFTYCLAFPRPPLALRQAMVHQQLSAHGCSPSLMDTVAGLDQTTPALVSATARFMALSQGSSVEADAAARAVVNGYLSAKGHTTIAKPRPVTMRFDMKYVNLAGTMTAEALLHCLQADGYGTALFEGPPGTGKTQLAAELARQLGRRLIVKTASDITSKWYGESERNVAAMFRDCDPQAEMILLDEGDVLLGDRSQAGQRVDRAVTAEFLRWLECFEGVFICATNHASTLDPALARRFTHRMSFLPMTQAQRCAMLTECLHDDAKPDGELPLEAQRTLQKLDQLTPGDFANVGRRLRHTQADLVRWLAELACEQQAKPGAQNRQIGFF